jgi:predicted ATPase
MIRLIEALNYRCLRYVSQPLEDFQILIGPNASGKTTFLDVIGFLSDLLAKGLDYAIAERATDIHDLFFLRQGERFELAVELGVPKDRATRLQPEHAFEVIRYEVSIGIDAETGEYHILDEQVILQREPSTSRGTTQLRTLFPSPPEPPETIMHSKAVGSGGKRTVRKVYAGNDNFYSEPTVPQRKKAWDTSIRLGPRKSALANMPEDESLFPLSTWLRETLISGTQKLMLNSLALRQSSRPGQGRLFKPDGSNLPWVIEGLRHQDMDRYRQWIGQLQTALPDIEDVLTVELPDTKHRFLQIVYHGGLKVPSWTASDGTLRMLALTLPAYLPHFEGIYLIEEPENGIHPMAMETVYQSLRSVYNAQILLATHSPVILGCARASEILCFKKDDHGATDIVAGPDHPALRTWQDSLNMSDLYASGVLG